MYIIYKNIHNENFKSKQVISDDREFNSLNKHLYIRLYCLIQWNEIPGLRF